MKFMEFMDMCYEGIIIHVKTIVGNYANHYYNEICFFACVVL